MGTKLILMKVCCWQIQKTWL